MTEHLRYLAQHARTFLSCLPNAGLPSIVDGHKHYDLTPEALADAHERFVTEFGLNIVGGCCGTTPEHLRAVVERIGTRAPVPRAPSSTSPGCSSIYQPGHRSTRSSRTSPSASARTRTAQEVPRRDARRRLGHLRADGARAGEGRRARPRRLRRLRRPRRRRRHGRDREPLRHAGRAPARARLHRAAGARSRAPALRRQGDPQLGQPRRGREPRASASTG